MSGNGDFIILSPELQQAIKDEALFFGYEEGSADFKKHLKERLKEERERLTQLRREQAERIAQAEREQAERIAQAEREQADREERQALAERDERLAEAERIAQAEREQAERIAQAEREERQVQADREAREAQNQHALEVLKRQQEHEMAQQRASPATTLSPTPDRDVPPRPRLPEPQPYQPGEEPLDRYLASYESFCDLTGVSAEHKAVGITNLLPSTLRIVLDNLTVDERRDFQAVRAALLRAGSYTQETCRKRFRDAEPTTQDTSRSFLLRKKQYLTDWLESAKVPEDMLTSFLVVDDFLHRMPSAFSAYVREKDTYDLSVVAQAADRYLDLHWEGRSLRSLQQNHLSQHRSQHNNRNNRGHQSRSPQQQDSSSDASNKKHQYSQQNGAKNSQSQTPSNKGTSGSKEPSDDRPYCDVHRRHGHSNAQCYKQKPQSTSHQGSPWQLKSVNALQTNQLPIVDATQSAPSHGVSLGALRLEAPEYIPATYTSPSAGAVFQRDYTTRPPHQFKWPDWMVPSPRLQQRLAATPPTAPSVQAAHQSSEPAHPCFQSQPETSSSECHQAKPLQLGALRTVGTPSSPPSTSVALSSYRSHSGQATLKVTSSSPLPQEPEGTALPLSQAHRPAFAAGTPPSPLLTRCQGEINGSPVTILLDSGAEGVFVDRSLVKPEQFTGQNTLVRMPEGPPVSRPRCSIELQCPYYSGTCQAVALEEPDHQVYLGPIAGITPFLSPAVADPRVMASLKPPALVPGGTRDPPGPVSPVPPKGGTVLGSLASQRVDPPRCLLLRVRASRRQIDASLIELPPGNLRKPKVVASIRRRLWTKERQYKTAERQVLASHWATRCLEPHLHGHDVRIELDSPALSCLQDPRSSHPKLEEWVEALHKRGYKFSPPAGELQSGYREGTSFGL